MKMSYIYFYSSRNNSAGPGVGPGGTGTEHGHWNLEEKYNHLSKVRKLDLPASYQPNQS